MGVREGVWVGVAVSVKVADGDGVSVKMDVKVGSGVNIAGVRAEGIWQASRKMSAIRSKWGFDFISGILSKHHGDGKMKNTYFKRPSVLW